MLGLYDSPALSWEKIEDTEVINAYWLFITSMALTIDFTAVLLQAWFQLMALHDQLELECCPRQRMMVMGGKRD